MIAAIFLLTILTTQSIPNWAFPTAGRFLARSAVSSAFDLKMTSIETYVDALSSSASDALGRTVTLKPTSGGGYSGGGGASTSAFVDEEGNKYFVKAASGGQDMLKAEYLGVKAMAETNTIKVPKPIAYGDFQNRGFVIFEYLEFGGTGSQVELGQQLAQMHRTTSKKGFGFEVDNTIGATPQPNPWMDDWADFWLEHRLGHMLKLTGNAGLDNAKVEKLIAKTRQLLSHKPQASLVHGDLWGGNKSFCKNSDKVIPVIFDPATYYGDREVDVAMTYVFGGFNNDFYQGRENEYVCRRKGNKPSECILTS